MVVKRIALMITSMFLAGGMLITACAVYEFNSSKETDVKEPITSEAVSTAVESINEPAESTSAESDKEPTERPATSVPEYSENCGNIKNLVIQKLQEKGLRFPEQPVTGDDAFSCTVGYYKSDNEYAQLYVNGNHGDPALCKGAASVSCWIEDGNVWISASSCDLPVE